MYETYLDSEDDLNRHYYQVHIIVTNIRMKEITFGCKMLKIHIRQQDFIYLTVSIEATESAKHLQIEDLWISGLGALRDSK